MKIVIDIPEEFYNDILNHVGGQHGITALALVALKAVEQGTPLPKCKDCKHFEKDAFATIDGIPLIIGHEVCTKWGAGCKTKEDGYCFMFEAKEDFNGTFNDVQKS